MEKIKYWIWISRIAKLGSIRTQKLLEKFETPEKIWLLEEADLLKIDGIGKDIAKEILNIKYRMNLEKIINEMKHNNIELITYKDKEYPSKLKELYDKPIVLYVKGNKKILNNFSLAIIGCRENSEYGKKVAEAIAKGLARKEIVTVSGLARGIDSISQRATVETNGKTIAVIGSGINNIYPKENVELANRIVKCGGAIVSEYEPTAVAKEMNFPARNRIISGLSSGIIVVEAKNKSGTMITVDFGLEQGKNIFAIPRKYNKSKFRRNKQFNKTRCKMRNMYGRHFGRNNTLK